MQDLLKWGTSQLCRCVLPEAEEPWSPSTPLWQVFPPANHCKAEKPQATHRVLEVASLLSEVQNGPEATAPSLGAASSHLECGWPAVDLSFPLQQTHQVNSIERCGVGWGETHSL